MFSLHSSYFNALHIVIIKKISEVVVMKIIFDLTSRVQNVVALFVTF